MKREVNCCARGRAAGWGVVPIYWPELECPQCCVLYIGRTDTYWVRWLYHNDLVSNVGSAHVGRGFTESLGAPYSTDWLPVATYTEASVDWSGGFMKGLESLTDDNTAHGQQSTTSHCAPRTSKLSHRSREAQQLRAP